MILDEFFAKTFLVMMNAPLGPRVFIMFWFLLPCIIIYIILTIWVIIVDSFRWVARLRGKQLLCVLLLYTLIVPSLRKTVSSAWEVVMEYAEVSVFGRLG